MLTLACRLSDSSISLSSALIDDLLWSIEFVSCLRVSRTTCLFLGPRFPFSSIFISIFCSACWPSKSPVYWFRRSMLWKAESRFFLEKPISTFWTASDRFSFCLFLASSTILGSFYGVFTFNFGNITLPTKIYIYIVCRFFQPIPSTVTFVTVRLISPISLSSIVLLSSALSELGRFRVTRWPILPFWTCDGGGR